MTYAALWCKSNFSFLEGASHPEELVEEAARLGLAAIALTDRDGLYGVVRAHIRAKELGVKLIIGSEMTLPDRTIVLLVENAEGYANLSTLITIGRRRNEKGSCSVTYEEVNAHIRGLIELPTGFPEVLYHTRERRPLQDILTCIRLGITLGVAGRRLRPNDTFTFRAPDDPALSLEIADRCRFSLDELRYRYPAHGTLESLRALTFAGARARYGQIPSNVADQIEKELELIKDLDYGGYFLTMKEIVDFCAEKKILCQGRGSAANSVVCYCLGITAIDPVRMELLFERFLSRERDEPPDIDLDIEHRRREEVIQHVYEKYGRDRSAMVANVIRYRRKSAKRDVEKVLGDPRFIEELLDFPRHLSIHPGGFVLGERPVHEIVPIENSSMPDRTVIQWNKDDIDALGLFKVDLLGLGALTHLHLCFDLLRTRGIELTLATIPPDDAATYEMICRGDTVGVFQIESRAQMAMLPRLRPKNFHDLVVEISLVRPGPITGGMVHPYLRRRCGEEPIVFPHPSLESVLKKTLGVPLFQEQVMKLAIVAADYTPGEADRLRRDMGAWKQTGRIERHRERMIGTMIGKGIPREFAEAVFQQVLGFGEYGFPESHAASFALIAYATAWLRCHYPVEFTCSLLNAQPMGFYSPATIIDDAKRRGVDVRPMDVGKSSWECMLEESAMRIGLRFLRGISRADEKRIEEARPFSSLRDFIVRTALSEELLIELAGAGALDAFEPNRRRLLWMIKGLCPARRDAIDLPKRAAPLFEELDDFETVQWDYRSSGHSARNHPLAPLRNQLTAAGLPASNVVARMKDGAPVRYAGIVICRQHPDTAGGTTFLTMEDETGFVNVVIWKTVFEKFAPIIKTTSFLGVGGKLQTAHGVTHIIAKKFWSVESDITLPSRDFR